jgi:hypothetical protein
MGTYLVQVEAYEFIRYSFLPGPREKIELLVYAGDETDAMMQVEKMYRECKSYTNNYYSFKSVSATSVMGNLTELKWAYDFFEDL